MAIYKGAVERSDIQKVYKGTTLLYEKLSTPSIPPRYVQTTTADFDASGDYSGIEEYIILPADKPSGYKITNINVKGVATNGDYLTDTVNMFYGNNSLYLELDYLNTSNVTSMGYMFHSSPATTLDLSSFDTSNVTSMSYMFRNSRATTLDLSSFDTSNVTDMSSMFRSSPATTLDLSSFDTSKAIYMIDMFNSSQATTGYARTQTDAYNFNSSSNKPSTLTFVVLSNIPSRYVQTTIADFNASGDYLGTEEYIILPEDKPSGYKIVNLNVKGVATNGDYLTNTSNMFNGNNSLYLELDYLDTSNVTNMASMFYNSKATTLDLSSFDTSNVTTMSNMFSSSQATTLNLSHFDTSKVTNMSQMFYSSEATTLDLSSFDTSNVTNMSLMFASSQATTLDLSGFDTSNVTNMNSMFQGSKATTGYARTQTDADKFNSSSNKPSALTFVVK